MIDNFKNFLNKIFNESKLILDAGARSGSFEYPANSKVLFFDNDVNFIPTNKTNFIFADCCQPPFKKNFFEVIVLKYVLEHTYFPEKIIKEISSLLKKDGYIIIVVPNGYSFQDILYRLLGFAAQLFKKGKQAHIQKFTFKKICDICYKNRLVLLNYTEYDSGLSFLDKTENRKKFKKILNFLIDVYREMTNYNLLEKGEIYFIFQKI